MFVNSFRTKCIDYVKDLKLIWKTFSCIFYCLSMAPDCKKEKEKRKGFSLPSHLYLVRVIACAQTRDLARKVVVGKATASETLHHSRPSSSVLNQRERGEGGSSACGARPNTSSALSRPQQASTLEGIRSGVDILSLESESNADNISNNNSNSAISTSSSDTRGLHSSRGSASGAGGSRGDGTNKKNGSSTSTNTNSGSGPNSGIGTAPLPLPRSRGSSSSRQRKRTPGPKVRRYVVTATPIYDSDSDDVSE